MAKDDGSQRNAGAKPRVYKSKDVHRRRVGRGALSKKSADSALPQSGEDTSNIDDDARAVAQAVDRDAAKDPGPRSTNSLEKSSAEGSEKASTKYSEKHSTRGLEKDVAGGLEKAPAKSQKVALSPRRKAALRQAALAANKADAGAGDSAAGQSDLAVKQDDPAVKQGDAITKHNDSAVGQVDPAAGRGNSAAKQDEPATKRDDLAAKQDEPATKRDDLAAKQDDQTAQQGDAAIKQGDSTPEREPASAAGAKRRAIVLPEINVSPGKGGSSPHQSDTDSKPTKSPKAGSGSTAKGDVAAGAADESASEAETSVEPKSDADAHVVADPGSSSERDAEDSRSDSEALDPDSAGESDGEHRRSKGSRAKRVIGACILLVILIAVALGAYYAWDRWGRYDDHADMQGEWYAAGTTVPITIESSRINLTDELYYDYEIDDQSKTIKYTFGPMEGQGRYWFSPDRRFMAITDGEGYTAVSTALDDLSHGFLDITSPGEITGTHLPDGEGVIVFCREPGHLATMAKEAAERGKERVEKQKAKEKEEAEKKAAEAEAAEAKAAEAEAEAEADAGVADETVYYYEEPVDSGYDAGYVDEAYDESYDETYEDTYDETYVEEVYE